MDIPAGHLIRANVNSGLDIEKPPFNIKVKAKCVIDEIPHSGSQNPDGNIQFESSRLSRRQHRKAPLFGIGLKGQIFGQIV